MFAYLEALRSTLASEAFLRTSLLKVHHCNLTLVTIVYNNAIRTSLARSLANSARHPCGQI